MLRSPISKFAPVLAALTFALTASAELPTVSKSKVSFHATGPAGLGIDGTGNDVTVEKSGKSVVFKTSVKGMKTGNGMRDGHLNDYLDVKTWPHASLSVDEDKLSGARKGNTISGKFKLHGKAVDKKVKYKVDGNAVTANFDVNLLDHFEKVPGYLGVEVKPKVTVEVKFTVKD
jgi:hypothetical protein